MERVKKDCPFKVLFILILLIGFSPNLDFARVPSYGLNEFYGNLSRGFVIKQAFAVEAMAGRTVVEKKCSQCHVPQNGMQTRISFQRKTPEGWEMTVTRMQLVHGLEISPQEKRAVIKYLSDEYGLAPAEVEGYEYLLYRKEWVVEEFPESLSLAQAVCARCHSFARTALQRRTLDDWLLHVDFHLGAFPTVEYQAGGRNIDWYGDAKKVAEILAKEFPFESEAWNAWKSKPKPDLQGKWRVVGHHPGVGDYQGIMEVTRTGEDQYKEAFTVEYDKGNKLSGTGIGLVYTGFQWRISTTLEDGTKAREVRLLSEDGNVATGRWFLANHSEIGGEDVAYKLGSGSKILAVSPKVIKTSQGATMLKIIGVDLPQNLQVGDISLGEGISVSKISEADSTTLTVEVTVDAAASIGKRDVTVGQITGTGLLGVYDKIDYIKVVPDNALARTGGTTAPKQLQQFEAIAFSHGADGIKDTEDDIDLGLVKARWEIKEFFRTFDEEDIKYVGSIDQNGLFTPAEEGLNPERMFQTNNVGDVWIEAAYQPEGAEPLMARAFLIVTVPRWVNPPLK